MKKNKSVVLALIFTIIILVQPQSWQWLKTTFTQKDIAQQLAFTNSTDEKNETVHELHQTENQKLLELSYQGQSVIKVHDKATFTEEELSLEKGSWESYKPLDWLNRVGEANALLGKELLPQTRRGDISSVKPTGWKNKKIIFNGKTDYLYNRCHLIAYELTGQNDNPNNLFTGTRALNANFQDQASSMLYYENLIAGYIKQTGHHVRYRVTPLFRKLELVARGIRLEAQSVEDDTISFDVYLFNVQPNYRINYLTGSSEKIKS
ncbi:TPA: DNA/RNA non-specific endonuclease [Streptococcus equi subsp. zooepidemicus]|nr:DNA/RNA non-specific endonuclease [Streptococcus equi subsp. zooepidemicus]